MAQKFKAKNFFLFILFAGLFFEFSAFISMRYGVTDALPYLFYKQPSKAARENFEEYFENRNAVIGWPRPDLIGKLPFDAAGARFSPAYPLPGNACISAYGDSFVWAGEVNASEAWPNILAKKLGCRVANYGVEGFGTDQSFLRFKKNDEEETTVILGIFPHNILRNLNQNRYFLVGTGNYFRLKPRYIVNAEGTLEIISLPTLSKNEFPDIITQPNRYFEHEFFLPGSNFGPVELDFPYSLVVLKLLINSYFWAHVKSFFNGSPIWMEFLSPDHPSQGLAITKGIVLAFANEAKARNKRLIVMVFPTPRTLNYYEANGIWAYDNLITSLKDENDQIEIVNLGTEFLRVLGTKSYCEILTLPLQCKGHLDARGNEILASIIFNKVQDRVKDRLR